MLAGTTYMGMFSESPLVMVNSIVAGNLTIALIDSPSMLASSMAADTNEVGRGLEG